MVVGWSARCAATVRFSHQKVILVVDLKGFDAFPHSDVDLFQYFQLVERVSAVLSLVKKLPGRSPASSEYTGHFFIGCVLFVILSSLPVWW